jgi:hypothetical protein
VRESVDVTPVATSTCSCGARVTEVDSVLPDAVVTMVSCSPCDRRWWLMDGEPVTTAEAIRLIGRNWSSVRSPRSQQLVA